MYQKFCVVNRENLHILKKIIKKNNLKLMVKYQSIFSKLFWYIS